MGLLQSVRRCGANFTVSYRGLRHESVAESSRGLTVGVPMIVEFWCFGVFGFRMTA